MSAAIVVLDVHDDAVAVALLLPFMVLQLAEGVTKPEAGATEAIETAPATASRLLTTTMFRLVPVRQVLLFPLVGFLGGLRVSSSRSSLIPVSFFPDCEETQPRNHFVAIENNIRVKQRQQEGDGKDRGGTSAPTCGMWDREGGMDRLTHVGLKKMQGVRSLWIDVRSLHA